MKNRFLQFTLMVILAGFGAGFLTVNAQQNEGDTGSMSATEYFAKIRNNQHTNAISPMDMYRADQQVAAMKNSGRSEFGWDFVGPTNMAGPVRTLIVDNRDASGNTLYAGSIQGGLWKSVDNGNVWNEVSVDTRLNISSICQAPDGTIYVATGVNLEPYKNELDMGDSYGKGIYKSTDGTNFSLMEGTTPADGGYNDLDNDWVFINKLAADGNGNVYAATNTGLKYFDATVSPNGNPWTNATADGVELTGIAYDVVVKGNTVIAAVENITYLSHNGHTGFANITGDDPNMLPADQIYTNAKFDIAEANNDYIYAVYITNKGRLASIYLSKDKGATWAVVHPGYSNNNQQPDPIFGDGNTIKKKPSYGKSHCCILTHPQDPNRVYVGGKVVFEGASVGSGYYSWSQKTNLTSLDVYLHIGVSGMVSNVTKPGNVYFTTDGGLSITTDNFATIKRINRNLTNSMYFTINAGRKGDVIAGSYNNGVHYIDDNTAHAALEMLSKPTTGGIIPKDVNGGNNHISFIDPDFFICGETGDASMWRSEDRGNTKETLVEDGVFAQKFITPFVMWESLHGEFAKDSMDFVSVREAAEGDTLIITSRTAKVPFYHVLDQDVSAGDTIRVLNPIVGRSFVATQRGVFMNTSLLDYTVKPVDNPNSTDLGAWWKLMDPLNGETTCIALSHNSDVLWVGTDAGVVYRISNLREVYNRATATVGDSLCVVETLEMPMGTQAITTISVDPQDSDKVLVGFGNYGNTDYVKVSTDANAATPTFNSAQGNLPQVPVYASTFESNREGFAFVGTDRGLYYTENIFASSVVWIMDESEFGDIPVTAIKQQDKNWGYYAVPEFQYYSSAATNYGEIYIGTFGNAIYKTGHFVGIPEIGENKNNDNQLFVYPNPATNQASIEYTANKMGKVQVEVYDVTGKMVMRQVYTVNATENTLDLNVDNLNNGMYLIYLNNGVQKLHTKLMITK